jgi:Concanavalin A-like lectin/glucanases superfamily/OSK domain
VPLPGGIANTSTSGTTPNDWWRLREGSGTTAYDSGGNNNATLTGATWNTSGPDIGIPAFNGTTGYAATSGPVVNTTGSFTVSAWVKLSSTAHNAVVAAQDGTNNSGFYLGYFSNGGQWAFYFLNSDTVNSGWQASITAAGATTNWTHLVGVYDATAKTAYLYVNGVLAGSATGVTPWSATGPFTIGRDKYYGNQADFFPGEIDDVRAWNSRLVAPHVSEVYHDNVASTLTTANALAAFDRNGAAEPNLRDVIVSLGANDVLEGSSAASIESNLTALVANLRGRYVNDESNTPVQVFLTTIAPLGLPASDGREAVRQAVNAWIMQDTGTNLSIDTASSVADPANINQTAAKYLTSGVPNAGYYNQIANTIAAALAAIPPTPLVVTQR